MISLPEGKFEIIYADPPWFYERLTTRHGEQLTGGAITHYPTMTESEISAMPVRDIADKDCLLFLWATGVKLDVAIRVGVAWGFKYVTIAFVWHKRRPNPGNYTMSECELVLVFKRGAIPKPRGARNVRQFISERCGQHSVKPREVRRRIEEMFPEQRKIELFARCPEEGWTGWGNESGGERLMVAETGQRDLFGK